MRLCKVSAIAMPTTIWQSWKRGLKEAREAGASCPDRHRRRVLTDGVIIANLKGVCDLPINTMRW